MVRALLYFNDRSGHSWVAGAVIDELRPTWDTADQPPVDLLQDRSRFKISGITIVVEEDSGHDTDGA